MAGPILAFLDQLRERYTEQIVVLIPVTVPDRARYRLLQNHYDLVLPPRYATASTSSPRASRWRCTWPTANHGTSDPATSEQKSARSG